MPNSIKIKDLWNGEWWLDLFLCRDFKSIISIVASEIFWGHAFKVFLVRKVVCENSRNDPY